MDYGYQFWKMTRNKLIFALVVIGILLAVIPPTYAQGPTHDPQQIEEARANNPKLTMGWVLVLATGFIGLLTLGLFLAFFPKGYQKTPSPKVETSPPPTPTVNETPSAPRVIYLADDGSEDS